MIGWCFFVNGKGFLCRYHMITILFYSCYCSTIKIKKGHAECVSVLLESNPKIHPGRPMAGPTGGGAIPLTIAADRNHPEVVKVNKQKKYIRLFYFHKEGENGDPSTLLSPLIQVAIHNQTVKHHPHPQQQQQQQQHPHQPSSP